MVLRFISYLVAKGYYRHVEVLYLIAGHTKNVCDTMFNTIKKSLLGKNLYTYEHLVEWLKGQKYKKN